MINYDKNGRIAYTPELHDRQGEPWTKEEIQYLIDWYNVIGGEEMSLALGRTETTIMTKANTLRKRGLLQKKSKHNAKLLKYEGKDNLIWRIYG